ncbi:patatin-like phospholipase family protein [Oerskovia sp. KBS0722]|uniref:patatin-like phospholipase family protein n=1 Tax=Oerskovia sp. KBS0722 TaxID=1179673 RepID=UPI00110D94D3|nr:patatin-like phospholipase family protein [Oerskovia sp. KBS0722]QDW63412.1 patatin-like phospholipase family protein [Oerskovia sp. KBS0722]
MNISPSSPSLSPATTEPGPQGRPAGGRAVVLGGGGSTGNAWLIGVVAGLFEVGVDVTTPDLTVGTSAGSTAAAQLSGAAPADLLATSLAAPPKRRAPVTADRGSASTGPVVDHLERMRTLIASAHDPADLRRRVGAAALEREAVSDGSWQERWRTTVASRLPDEQWPLRRVLLTAVDAETGEPMVFDRDSGVDLVDAVAASCSSGLPYAIDGRRYIDGGYRRNENADLAAGYGRVLVLSPFGGRSLTPPSWGLQLATQVDELRARGSEVVTIVPEAGSEHLFGANAMDLSLRPLAARAGYEQGLAVAGRLTEFWR